MVYFITARMVCLYGVFCSIKRPTAKELLKHRFIRSARKTSYLTELIEKHKRWKAAGGDGSDSGSDDDMPAEYVCYTVDIIFQLQNINFTCCVYCDSPWNYCLNHV